MNIKLNFKYYEKQKALEKTMMLRKIKSNQKQFWQHKVPRTISDETSMILQEFKEAVTDR